MQAVRINGLRLHAAVSGDPDGAAGRLRQLARHRPPGLGPAPPAPARRACRIVRYDMRGHGLSDAPEGDYFMGDLVADAAGLMDALGISGAVFVGLSIGGVVAQGLAAERPDLVRAAVLSNTAAKIGTEASWRDRIADRARGRHRGDRRRGDGALVHQGASTPTAPTSSRSGAHADPHAASTATCGCCAAIVAHRPARVRPPACACRSSPSPAPTTARPRPTSCARPPRASPAPASRSSAAPATSLASRRRRRWRGSSPPS